MKISREIVNALKIADPVDVWVYLTTCDVNGKCNMSPQLFTDVYDDEFILMPDLFAVKTKINLNENKMGVITVANPSEGHSWALRGPCGHMEWGLPDNYNFQGLKAGDILKKWGEWVDKEPIDSLPDEVQPGVIAQRGVIVLKVAECYSYSAGEAGNKL